MRKQTKNTILLVLWLKKVKLLRLFKVKKKMFPITFCTGPNPPINIDLSLILL